MCTYGLPPSVAPSRQNSANSESGSRNALVPRSLSLQLEAIARSYSQLLQGSSMFVCSPVDILQPAPPVPRAPASYFASIRKSTGSTFGGTVPEIPMAGPGGVTATQRSSGTRHHQRGRYESSVEVEVDSPSTASSRSAQPVRVPSNAGPAPVTPQTPPRPQRPPYPSLFIPSPALPVTPGSSFGAKSVGRLSVSPVALDRRAAWARSDLITPSPTPLKSDRRTRSPRRITRTDSSVSERTSRTRSSSSASADASDQETQLSSAPPSPRLQQSRTQCSGKNKNGAQCKNKKKVPEKTWYCNTHLNQRPRTKASKPPGLCSTCGRSCPCTASAGSTPSPVSPTSPIPKLRSQRPRPGDNLIPPWISANAQARLKELIRTPISDADKKGFIYALSAVNVKYNPDNFVILKVGRSVDVRRRLKEWEKQCPGADYELEGTFPKSYARRDHGANCYERLEALVHAELLGLLATGAYMDDNFDSKWPRSTEDHQYRTSKRISAENISYPSDYCGCGKRHKELFTFRLEGPYAGEEWEKIVLPIVKRWSRYLDTVRTSTR